VAGVVECTNLKVKQNSIHVALVRERIKNDVLVLQAGGLGNSLADLPVAGCAPEWMSEKALAIGQYFVTSGVFTVFGIGFFIVKETKFYDLMFNGVEKGYDKWGTAADPIEIAQMMIAHIDKNRKEVGIDKARERILVDMSDRRDLVS
jgi:anaerobic carbon-monoxide dehydrogenase catalytic subunit